MSQLAPAHPPTLPDAVPDKIACARCAYILAGLPPAGSCPECGLPVAESFSIRHLRFADPDYRRRIHAGLGFILNGILLGIIVNVADQIMTRMGVHSVLLLIAGAANIIIQIMIAIGYWRYTTPDPGLDPGEQAHTARLWARVSIITGVVATLIAVIVGLLASAMPVSGPPTPAQALLGLVAIVVLLVLLAATVIQFIAVMTYTAWIAWRVSDHATRRKALRYRWLLPVIAILGAPLLLLGPLFALVLYWNLLHKLRKEIAAIPL
jgi:amino acid transporter